MLLDLGRYFTLIKTPSSPRVGWKAAEYPGGSSDRSLASSKRGCVATVMGGL